MPLSASQPKPGRRRGLGLGPRIMLMTVSGILILGICITLVAKYVLEQGAAKSATERVETNMRVAWNVLRESGDKYSIADGKLLADGKPLNGNFAAVDKIKTLVGGTATIFMNDTRISTNVMKPDGTRAIGTQLAKGPAYDAVFNGKTAFRGEVAILGEPYMTVYDPIFDASRNVIGILYVGIKKVEFLETANDTLWTIIYATLGVMLLAIIVSYVVARSSVVRPLKASIATMNKLAKGDLTVDVPASKRADEIGEIMTALSVFKENGLEVERMKVAQIATESRTAEQRKADMMKLAADFEGAVGQIVETVSSASKELEGSATTLTATSDRSQVLAVRCIGGIGRSRDKRAVGRIRHRGDVVVRARDQPPGAGRRAHCQRGCCAGRQYQQPRQRTGDGRGTHRRCRRADQQYRGADQSAGAQRDHRGGARR